jgi:putative peptidoglycan lipid II flippase
MSLLKSVAKVGGLTLISRLFGFVRDQLIAFTLGTGAIAEAFFVAQRLPNLFRALFAEGAFNNAFVPQFARKLEGEGKDQAFGFARDVLSVLLNWMVLFSALAMIFMPWVMVVLAPGFRNDAATFELTIELTRICFPYLGLMSLTALFSGILNSLGRFTAAAAAPIILNIVVISVALLAWWLGLGNSADTGRLLAWGVTLSGVIQMLLLLVTASRAGAKVKPGIPRLTPDVKRVIGKAIPGIISGGVTQINLMIATMLATSVTGGVAFLYYADRLFQLPLGVIGVAIGVVLLPTLSKKLRGGDAQGALDTQNRALEFALFLTLPAAAALIVIGRPILHTVFEHGAFTRDSTLAVAPALAAFAAGLPAFTLMKIFQPSFFAREDTKTPMYFAFATVAVNIAASFVLLKYFGHVGIAVATSVAAWLNAFALILTAKRRGYYKTDQRLRSKLPRIFISLGIMVGVLWGLMHFWLSANYVDKAGFSAAVVGLLILLGGGIGSYFVTAHVTGAFRLSDLRSAMRR